MRNSQEKNKIACCGINCASCAALLASTKATELLSEEGNQCESTCKGCQEPWGKKPTFCKECQVRLCAREKNYNTCAECANYPCDKLENLFQTLGENSSKHNLDLLVLQNKNK